MIRGCLLDEQGGVVFENALKADGFFEKLRGLLGRGALRTDQAMVLERCNSVHTFAMRYPIDIIFLDTDGHVVKVVDSLKPYRYAHCLSARTTVELRAGAAKALNLASGIKLRWSDAAGVLAKQR